MQILQNFGNRGPNWLENNNLEIKVWMIMLNQIGITVIRMLKKKFNKKVIFSNLKVSKVFIILAKIKLAIN